jgi:5-methylcytosine-specific restriction protein A
MIGSGYAISDSYVAKHWDQKKAASGARAKKVDLRFEVLLPTEQRLTTENLINAKLKVPWNSLMSSGIRVPDESAAKLEDLWSRHLDMVRRRLPTGFTLPDEIARDVLLEGAKTQIVINAYERNPIARAECLEHWGHDCSVCGFNFEDVYGKLGEKYINVHHLKDLASVGKEYDVDAIKDLRPVCPNCHAMLHQEKPAMSIRKLKSLLRR